MMMEPMAGFGAADYSQIIAAVKGEVAHGYNRQIEMLKSQVAKMSSEMRRMASNASLPAPPPVRMVIDDGVTYEEKKRLSQDIEKLDEESLKEVITLIHERTPIGSASADPNYFEIDLDVLDADTIRELQRLVGKAKSASRRRRTQVASPVRRGGGMPGDVAEAVERDTDRKIAEIQKQLDGPSAGDSATGSSITGLGNESSSEEDSDGDDSSDDGYGF